MPHSLPTHAINSQSHVRILPTRSLLGWRMKTALPVGLSRRMHSGTTVRIRSHHSASVHVPYERLMQGYGGSVSTRSNDPASSVGSTAVVSP